MRWASNWRMGHKKSDWGEIRDAAASRMIWGNLKERVDLIRIPGSRKKDGWTPAGRC